MSDGEWYNSEQLTTETGYIHPNRALTDMREQGYDIEYQGRFENGRVVGYWRLKSKTPVREPRRRKMLSKAEAEIVFKKYDYTCALCRTKLPSNLLRGDHKLPISRGGDQLDENDQDWVEKFQCLCHWCNYEKREICKVCTIPSCNGCELYDPLEYSGLMLKLAPDLVERLMNVASESGIPLKVLASEMIKKGLDECEET